MEDRSTLLALIKQGHTTADNNHKQLLESHKKIHIRIDKHETRIGKLELWRAGLVGGLGIIGTVLGVLVIVFKAWRFVGL